MRKIARSDIEILSSVSGSSIKCSGQSGTVPHGQNIAEFETESDGLFFRITEDGLRLKAQ